MGPWFGARVRALITALGWRCKEVAAALRDEHERLALFPGECEDRLAACPTSLRLCPASSDAGQLKAQILELAWATAFQPPDQCLCFALPLQAVPEPVLH